VALTLEGVRIVSEVLAPEREMSLCWVVPFCAGVGAARSASVSGRMVLASLMRFDMDMPTPLEFVSFYDCVVRCAPGTSTQLSNYMYCKRLGTTLGGCVPSAFLF
jgi:hypothetical protein